MVLRGVSSTWLCLLCILLYNVHTLWRVQWNFEPWTCTLADSLPSSVYLGAIYDPGSNLHIDLKQENNFAWPNHGIPVVDGCSVRRDWEATFSTGDGVNCRLEGGSSTSEVTVWIGSRNVVVRLGRVPIIAVEGGENRTGGGVSEPIGDEHSHNRDGKNWQSKRFGRKMWMIIMYLFDVHEKAKNAKYEHKYQYGLPALSCTSMIFHSFVNSKLKFKFQKIIDSAQFVVRGWLNEIKRSYSISGSHTN